MTTHSTLREQQNIVTYQPGTVVYDVIAGTVGRAADPEAYPPGCMACACVLVVPLSGCEPAGQVGPGALRHAAYEEVEAAVAAVAAP
ncbi:hypothetical protein [Streptomyces sp. CA2R101]|uniref:hypothetical protein n=1 Tax=Streptomyces sp. CA2R101 TaxID=3120152 RepID=UPI00300A2790